jgi:hypothetical protein
MAVEDEQLSEGDYERWIPPGPTLARLAPIPRTVAVEAIAARVRSGTMRAAAQIVVQVSTNGQRQHAFFRILRAGEWIDEVEDRFWAIGDLTLLPDALRDSGYRHLRIPAGGPTFEIHGVRFDPAGVERIRAQFIAASITPDPLEPLPPSAPPPAEPRGKLAPKVGSQALLNWVQEFGARNPNSPFGLILQNAKSAFPKFRVTERPVKAAIAKLGMTRSRGNPTITQK